jgi:DNA-binding GntR family transcriptional regulator
MPPRDQPESLLGTALGRSAGHDVYETVRRAIIDGAMRPGERIVEERVAKTLGVSRTPVREALLRLERENLVARSGRGMAVRSFSAAEVRDIYDLRAHVESYGARLATRRITEYELRELHRVHEEMVQELSTGERDDLDSLKRLARLNQRFHLNVVQAARSAPLERIMTHVVQTPLIYKSYLWYDEQSKARSARDHEELIGHLAAGDAEEAERCWRTHIEFGRDILVEKLTAQQPWSDVDL